MCLDCLKRKEQCEKQGKQFYACSWCWAQQQGFIPEWWKKARCLDDREIPALVTGKVGGKM